MFNIRTDRAVDIRAFSKFPKEEERCVVCMTATGGQVYNGGLHVRADALTINSAIGGQLGPSAYIPDDLPYHMSNYYHDGSPAVGIVLV